MAVGERWCVALVALVAFAAAAAGLGARATSGARVTADEPQYLLTAQSIADDGSLDISDEIAERAYLPYHEITIDRQTAVLDDGREISPHDPLLPLLLAPAMAIDGWVAAKLTLALIAAATAAVAAWTSLRRLDADPLPTGLVIGAAFAGLPLAGYGSQVYPEMPAALAVVAGYAALTSPVFGRRHWAIATAAVLALPWLAVKYVPVAAVLGVGVLLMVGDRRRRVVAGAWFTTAGLAYLALHRLWYGGWTVYSTGDHFEATGEFSVVGTDVDVVGRTRRITGLLVDRDFGLAAWSPIWLLLPIAAALITRHRPRGWGLWLGVVGVGWINATYVALTMHGWWVPGRQLVVVLPLGAIGIAWLVQRHRRLVPLAAVAGALGAVNWIWLAVEASTGRRTLVVDFMETAALPYRVWSPILPSGLDASSTDLVVLVAWTVALVVATTWAVRRPVSDRRSR